MYSIKLDIVHNLYYSDVRIYYLQCHVKPKNINSIFIRMFY